MKACLVIAILFLGLTVAASIQGEDKLESSHVIHRRQIVMAPPGPGCVFYECIARCKQRGYKGGGYCTMTGCQCVR